MKRRLDLDALLAQESWIRRLALDLTRDEARAEDVAQDVVAAALEARPHLEAGKLRAWLRTVTRRTATEARRKDDVRSRAERLAARSESVDDTAQARLVMHRRLNQAIERLPAPYRTALILRYLEGKPPRVIAKELGIAPTAARKRVSHGLGLLREQLDGEFGERTAWIGALGACGLGEAASIVGTGAVAASAGTSLLTLLTMKKTVLVVGAILVSALALPPLFDRDTPERSGPTVTSDAEPEADSVVLAGEDVEASLTRTRERSGVAPQLASSAKASSAPRVRVVDALGQPILQASVAWIDGEGEVNALELDESNAAELPGGIAGSRFFAQADGLGMTTEVLVDPSVDLVLVLEPVVNLRGVVRVDGQAPGEPLTIDCWPKHDRFQLQGDWEARNDQKNALRALGIRPTAANMEQKTDAAGHFRFEGFHPEGSGRLILPQSFAFPKDPERSWMPTNNTIDFQLPENDLVLEVTRIPRLFGQVVWDDTGEPVGGTMITLLVPRDGGPGGSMAHKFHGTGRFEVGLPYLDDERPELGLAHERVDITFHPDGPMAEDNEHSFRVSIDEIPRDVGTIRLTRTRESEVLVTDSDGTPLPGALAITTQRTYTTSPLGRATVSTGTDDRVCFVARGCKRTWLELGTIAPNEDGLIVVALEAGVGLALKASFLSNHPEFYAKVALEIGDGFLAGSGSEDTSVHLQNELFDLGGPRMHTFGWAKDGETRRAVMTIRPEPIRFAGLTPGFPIVVELLDRFDRSLERRPANLPTRPETLELDLAPAIENTLTVRIVDEAGALVPGATLAYSTEHFQRKDELEAGVRVYGPVALEPLSFVATAAGHESQAFDVEIDGSHQEVEVVLMRAHPLTLSIVDATGAAVRPDWIRLDDGADWSAFVSLGDSQLFPPEELVGDAVHLESVPYRRVTATVRTGATETRVTLGAGDERATIEVPTLGEFVATLASTPVVEAEWASLQLLIWRADLEATPDFRYSETKEYPPGAWTVQQHFPRGAEGERRLAARLAPGKYRYLLRLMDPVKGRGNVELDSGEIEVQAGKETVVDR